MSYQIQPPVPRTTQPSDNVPVNRSVYKTSSDIRYRGLIRPWIGEVGFDPYVNWTITGTPSKAGISSGMSYQFGVNTSLNTPAMIAGDSGGTQYFRNLTIIAVCSWVSNAATDTAVSIGSSKSDGAPLLLFQNNADTLRIYDRGGYTTIGPAEVNKPYCLVYTYREGIPIGHPRTIFVNGKLIKKGTGYSSLGRDLWLGAGYPGDSNNSRLLAAYFQVGVDCNLPDQQAQYISANPWQIFEPRTIWIPTAAAAAGGLSIPVASYHYQHNIGSN